MFLTDSFEDKTADSALEGGQQIAAEDLHSVGFPDLVPKVFQANGCLGVSILPQYRGAFAAGGNTSSVSTDALPDFDDQIDGSFTEPNRIGQTIEHKRG